MVRKGHGRAGGGAGTSMLPRTTPWEPIMVDTSDGLLGTRPVASHHRALQGCWGPQLVQVGGTAGGKEGYVRGAQFTKGLNYEP